MQNKMKIWLTLTFHRNIFHALIGFCIGLAIGFAFRNIWCIIVSGLVLLGVILFELFDHEEYWGKTVKSIVDIVVWTWALGLGLWTTHFFFV